MLTRRHLLLCDAPLACCASTPPAPRDGFIFLETGSPTPDDREAVMHLQLGHIENFQQDPVAEVLFARTTDDAALAAALAPFGADAVVWGHWLGKGVLG